MIRRCAVAWPAKNIKESMENMKRLMANFMIQVNLSKVAFLDWTTALVIRRRLTGRVGRSRAGNASCETE